jgi:bis(5'-nucleosidyl)-tetraphosphatase
MPRRERSAGVVVFRAGREADPFPRFLLLNYGGHWDYPKGHVEPGEDDATAARRELREETGILDATFIPGFSREINYFFRDSRKGLIRKEVIFFLARASSDRITLSHEHVGSTWLPFESAMQRLTYPNARQVLGEANAFLTGSTPPARGDTAPAAKVSQRQKTP